MKVYSFPHGGIVAEDETAPAGKESSLAFLPSLVIIPLIHYTRSRAAPLCEVGETVREAQVLAEGRSAEEAHIHSPIPGRVVRRIPWQVPEGSFCDALVIALEGSFDHLGRREETHSWENASVAELRSLIKEYGVVDMDGKGRPLNAIFDMYRAFHKELTLVVRGVFDDPWLAADRALYRERKTAIATGAVIAARAAGVKRILFAISAKERETVEPVADELSSFGMEAEKVFVGSRYPQRNRRELNEVLQNYIRTENKPDVTMVYIGPATLAALYDAVVLHKCALERYVAVGGASVANPRVLRVRIGTRIGDLFEECGGFVKKPASVALESPILGWQVPSRKKAGDTEMSIALDEPVTKTTRAVFAATRAKSFVEASAPCIGCGECRRVCPVSLDPEAIYKDIAGGYTASSSESSREAAKHCHGCACCEVVCPSGLPLGTTIVDSLL